MSACVTLCPKDKIPTCKKVSVQYVGVRFVTAQSIRNPYHVMTCLRGDCVVLVTITVTTVLYTEGDTVLLP